MRLPVFFCWCLLFSGVCSASWWDAYDLSKTAVVVKPVADLFVQSAEHYTNVKPATALFRHQALSCEPSVSLPCMRAHQALFNECMVDARIEGHEVIGRVPKAVYGYDAYDSSIKMPIDSFYADKRSVVFLSDLIERGVSLDYIPAPAWEHDVDQMTVTLMLPWTDAQQTQQKFSVGTRFVRIEQNDTFTHYAIVYVDYAHLKPVFAFVPKTLCVSEALKKHPRALFVKILKTLLDYVQPGLIPYVWGGSSFVQSFPNEPYALVNRNELNQAVSYYQRVPAGQEKSGFDCSELVWRIAQMAGLDYVFKNTGMIEQQGIILKHNELLSAGDLIWIRGHVMIADDVLHDKLAEAASYGSGFGRVHEIDLAKRFYGISQYRELEDAYRKHACLTLLNANGGNATSCKPFKLFKLVED